MLWRYHWDLLKSFKAYFKSCNVAWQKVGFIFSHAEIIRTWNLVDLEQKWVSPIFPSEGNKQKNLLRYVAVSLVNAQSVVTFNVCQSTNLFILSIVVSGIGILTCFLYFFTNSIPAKWCKYKSSSWASKQSVQQSKCDMKYHFKLTFLFNTWNLYQTNQFNSSNQQK